MRAFSSQSLDSHSCTYATYTHTLILGCDLVCLNRPACHPVCMHYSVQGCRSLQVHVGIIRLCCRSGWGSNVLIRLPRSAKALTVTLTV